MTENFSAEAASFQALLEKRYACKLFDPERSVGPSERRFILEAGRLSPSSFGLEPWLFVVSDSAEQKAGFYGACFGQENLRTADFIVTIAVRRAAHYNPCSAFVAQRAERFPGGLPVFLADYRGYWEYLDSNGLTEHWARSQGYIACANMINAAAAVGVDSCPIEGFSAPDVLRLLSLDPADWCVSLLIPFGYRAEEVRGKIREPFDTVIRRV